MTHAKLVVSVTLAVVAASSVAHADQYEATILLRPLRAQAQIDEVGAATPLDTQGGGGAVRASWGLRNWLDASVEVGAAGFERNYFGMATLPIRGRLQTGFLDRATRVTYLQPGATLRLGTKWIPTLYVGLGVGGRYQTAAHFHVDVRGTVEHFTPDDMGLGVKLDLVGSVRLGFEHRFDRHWTAGVSAGASHFVGVGMPDLQLMDASVGVAYSWYAFLAP